MWSVLCRGDAAPSFLPPPPHCGIQLVEWADNGRFSRILLGGIAMFVWPGGGTGGEKNGCKGISSTVVEACASAGSQGCYECVLVTTQWCTYLNGNLIEEGGGLAVDKENNGNFFFDVVCVCVGGGGREREREEKEVAVRKHHQFHLPTARPTLNCIFLNFPFRCHMRN